MELTARDIMDAQVICIQADATVKEALEFLVAPPLPGVLVLDAAGHLVGTLAMLDVMEGAEPMGGAAGRRSVQEIRVWNLMNTTPAFARRPVKWPLCGSMRGWTKPVRFWGPQ